MRRFVIGDIHGCSKALTTLLELIAPTADDEIVFLGDYVDRGPDSKGVVDQIIALQDQCNVVTLLGNHEIMLRGVALGGLDGEMWESCGGKATVTSYGGALSKMSDAHRAFYRDLKPYYETAQEIFVHACYEYHLPMKEQTEEMMYWTHLNHLMPPPHCSGKRVFVGHTPQPGGMVLDIGYLVCVDTYCFGNGYLTAMNVDNNEVIQVDRKGFRRRAPAEQLIARIKWVWSLLRPRPKSDPNKA